MARKQGMLAGVRKKGTTVSPPSKRGRSLLIFASGEATGLTFTVEELPAYRHPRWL